MYATYRTRIRRSLRGCRLRLSLGLDLFEDEYCLDLFGLLIALPFLDRWHREPDEMMESWGFRYFERTIHFNWGQHCKIVHMPWDYTFISHEVLRPDGSWTPYVGSWETAQPIKNNDGVIVVAGGKQPDGRKLERFPYHYVLRSGEVQERIATVHTERWEWRQRWLKWCPFFAKKRTSIDIQFNDEVGEETGSWKGGCIGSGWDLKPNETPEQALRRMEAERKF